MTITNVTITSAQAEELRAVARAHSAHAAKQAEWFIDAALSGDPDAWQYAGNPDLVSALGHQTADRYLGLDLP